MMFAITHSMNMHETLWTCRKNPKLQYLHCLCQVFAYDGKKSNALQISFQKLAYLATLQNFLEHFT